MIKNIRDLGEEILDKIYSENGFKNKNIINRKNWLKRYKFFPGHPDESYAWLSVVLALKYVESGNYCVGRLLVDADGKVISMGHNLVYSPIFRSALHAEMFTLNLFENEHPEIITLEGYKRYTSLESCPMCLVRLISSGINAILHVSPDLRAGMVGMIFFLPPL